MITSKETKELKLGWLDRRGKFREVSGYQAHMCYADSLNKTEEDLEQMGWVKITFDGINNKYVAIWDTIRLSKPQLTYLNNLGFEVDYDTIGYVYLYPKELGE